MPGEYTVRGNESHPGAATPIDLLQARGDHSITLSGPAAKLATIVSDVPATPCGDGQVAYEARFIYFLVLPMLILSTDFPADHRFAQWIIGCTRLGIVLDLVLSIPSLDRTPAAAVVVRARLSSSLP